MNLNTPSGADCSGVGDNQSVQVKRKTMMKKWNLKSSSFDGIENDKRRPRAMSFTEECKTVEPYSLKKEQQYNESLPVQTSQKEHLRQILNWSRKSTSFDVSEQRKILNVFKKWYKKSTSFDITLTEQNKPSARPKVGTFKSPSFDYSFKRQHSKPSLRLVVLML